MNYRCIFLVLIAIPVTIFSQKKMEENYFPESKGNFKKAAKYYLKKRIDTTSGFTKYYASLFSEIPNYTTKDRLLALKLINRLYQFDDILFFKLMQIRLEWNFRERISYSPLYSVRGPLKNNIDSANYSLLLGIYFKDTLIERVARHMGYVRGVNPSVEIVDWQKMKTMKWVELKKMEQLPNYDTIIPFVGKGLKDSSFKYYKRAIELDSTQFYHIKEFLIYLYKFGEDMEIQQLIISKIKNYNKKEKIWLEKLLTISTERKKQMGTTKTWFELL